MATPLLTPAFPFVNVHIDLTGLASVAQRNPGVVAVVGDAATGAAAPADTPVEVTDSGSVAAMFGTSGTLTASLLTVLQQDPRPAKVYGVRTSAAGAYAEALSGLEAADDVTFVCLANEHTVGNHSDAAGTAATGLCALSEHVEKMSGDGQKRMAVAMIDPATAKSPTYATDVLAAYGKLKSDHGRMILIAARGATGDAGAAAMGTIAGYAPSISMVLKQVSGITMPVTTQYAPAEITQLAEQGVIPLIDPALIPGTGLYLGDGGTFSSTAKLCYIDIVRTLDDIEFRLRAGLIGAVGDSRITKAGLTALRVRMEGILDPLQLSAVIDSYEITIPLLAALSVPEASRTAGQKDDVDTARMTRQVTALVRIVYGPAVHQLNITLAPSF